MEEQNYRFKVCVRSLIYNHEKYINDCLRGFLMQEVSFPVVFLLEDDASTDSTSQILSDWVNTNFNVEDKEVARVIDFEGAVTTFAQHRTNPYFFVAYIQMKYNHYGKFSRDAYNSEWLTSAKYIAMCEGDDYWIDPLKLQKQVDFLESHEEYAMCLTNSNTLYGDGKMGVAVHTIWDTYDTEQVLLHNSLNQSARGDEIVPPAHTSTIFYRRPGIANPDWFKKCFIGDEPLIIWISTFGKVKFLNEITSVYRQNVGVSSKNFTFEKDYLNRIQMYKVIDEGLGYKYHKLIYGKIISQYDKKLAKLYYREERYLSFMHYVILYFTNLAKL